jgi:hypothetical protein
MDRPVQSQGGCAAATCLFNHSTLVCLHAHEVDTGTEASFVSSGALVQLLGTWENVLI